MDDVDFEDLFAEVDLLADSSQESLITGETNSASLDSTVCDQESQESSLSTFDEDFNDYFEVMKYKLPFQEEMSNRSMIRSSSAQPHYEGIKALAVTEGSAPKTNYECIPTTTATDHTVTVVQKIEKVFETFTDALLAKKNELAVSLKTRKKATNTSAASAANVTYDDTSLTERRICFPGKSEDEAWRFSMIPSYLRSSLGLTESSCDRSHTGAHPRKHTKRRRSFEKVCATTLW